MSCFFRARWRREGGWRTTVHCLFSVLHLYWSPAGKFGMQLHIQTCVHLLITRVGYKTAAFLAQSHLCSFSGSLRQSFVLLHWIRWLIWSRCIFSDTSEFFFSFTWFVFNLDKGWRFFMSSCFAASQVGFDVFYTRKLSYHYVLFVKVTL